jgi:uncharacterized damage-inducible protein DinB
MTENATVDHYVALARYNGWMNEKLFTRAASLEDADRKRDLGAFFHSVHGTLNHLLLADRVWLGRFTGRPEDFASRDAAGNILPVRALSQELYTDFEQLWQERRATDRAIEDYASTLTPGAVAGPFTYQSFAGDSFTHPLWWALTHFFNHQTHHRGQASALLTRLGADVGVTDFIAFIRT